MPVLRHGELEVWPDHLNSMSPFPPGLVSSYSQGNVAPSPFPTAFPSRGLQGSLWDFRTVLRGSLKPPQSPLLSVTHQVTLQVRSHH